MHLKSPNARTNKGTCEKITPDACAKFIFLAWQPSFLESHDGDGSFYCSVVSITNPTFHTYDIYYQKCYQPPLLTFTKAEYEKYPHWYS
jgi:hypothetical protein